MMTYATLQSDCREFLALTGLTLQEFQLLLNAFTPAYERRYPSKDRTFSRTDPVNGAPVEAARKCWTIPGRSCSYPSWSILKTYPLQVLMGRTLRSESTGRELLDPSAAAGPARGS